MALELVALWMHIGLQKEVHVKFAYSEAGGGSLRVHLQCTANVADLKAQVLLLAHACPFQCPEQSLGLMYNTSIAQAGPVPTSNYVHHMRHTCPRRHPEAVPQTQSQCKRAADSTQYALKCCWRCRHCRALSARRYTFVAHLC